MANRKLVTVVWGDANCIADEMTLDDIKGGAHPSIIHTHGYVVHENDQVLAVAGEWLPASHGGDETFRNVTFIPKPWLIEQPKKRKRGKTSTASTPFVQPVTAETSTE